MTGQVKPHSVAGWRLATLVVVVVGALATLGTPALAASGPGWYLTGRSYPTNISPGGTGLIELQVFNVGAADSNGTVTVTDTLPAGLEATEAGELRFAGGISPSFLQIEHNLWHCTGTTVVTCTSDPANMPHIAGGAGGSTGAAPPPGEGPNHVPQIAIAVRALPGAPEDEQNRATIAGGGAPTPASTVEPVKISSSPPPFGFAGWDVWFSNADGTLDTQAGSHPYAATFSFDLNNVPRSPEEGGGFRASGGDVRNIEVRLPPGLVGNPNAVAQCTLQEFNGEFGGKECPPGSVIGFDDAEILGGGQNRQRVYNMVPPKGVAAEFAFVLNGVTVFLDSGVRSGSDYGITTKADNTPQRDVIANFLTLWGTPDDPSHTRWRDDEVGGCSVEEVGTRGLPPGGSLKPLLTLPTSCGGPPVFSIRANTWTNEAFIDPTLAKWHDSNGTPTGLTGCDRLSFAPAIATKPDTVNADTPAGLTVEVNPPVGGLEDPEGVSTADIQNTTVTLPEGFVINPGQAAGLQACQFAEAHVGDGNDGPASCPSASKVGTVTIRTPLVEAAAEKELVGNVYVLQSNPPELKLLVAASADGVNLKLVGTVHLNEQTGRLTTTFEGTPELPFTSFKLSFSGGAQAALETPTACGVYATTSDFTSWASPFVSDAFPGATFAITNGPGGGACPSSPMPFSPSLVAGSTTDQAGAFTNFSLLLQRGDAQQRIEKLQFKEPAGLAGLISSVPLCDEANANAGTCSAASHIGHAVVTSGPGPYPLVLPQPGAPELPIYLTGPYKGAPFGLSIVTPVIAGPFNLGTIVTRAKIEVDPRTAQITITTDPLPQIVHGVPTDLRSINSIIDRPGFLFNPTNCTPAEFTGTAWGTPPPGAAGPGATAAISSHFGIGSCRELAFKPQFKVSTSGKTSRKNGASLDVKLAYPKAPFGSQANIRSVKVKLPKQLPSRLTTLQKACTDKVFNANPAACPVASRVGSATTTTPILPVPLNGPVYFVSHGAAKFPELIIILQGYGVTVQLHGETFISKTGITSTTFKTVPDVPVGSFELKLPLGRYSALAANGNLCKQKLLMPTRIVAQNGAVINQSTKIAVGGCAKPKVKKPAKRKKK
jgi:uncharacterized repeat protein (TIGR01451 family)